MTLTLTFDTEIRLMAALANLCPQTYFHHERIRHQNFDAGTVKQKVRASRLWHEMDRTRKFTASGNDSKLVPHRSPFLESRYIIIPLPYRYSESSNLLGRRT